MMRIGHGYDIHKLVFGRKLILCGEEIEYEKGALGHSDADTPVHAIIDSLLGAAGFFDIGNIFKETDPAYEGISSLLLLEKTAKMLEEKNFEIINIDTTIVLQAPKISSYIKKMKKNISSKLKISKECVNVKAKTNEGLGDIGKNLAVASFAVCLLNCKNS